MATLDGDRDRLAEIEAIAKGHQLPPPGDDAAAIRRARATTISNAEARRPCPSAEGPVQRCWASDRGV